MREQVAVVVDPHVGRCPVQCTACTAGRHIIASVGGTVTAAHSYFVKADKTPAG